MNETLVTIVGNVASAVTYGQTTAGVPVANFRMATTERRFDRGAGDWVDGETSWVTVVAWRRLATNVVSSVNKGDPVMVSGRLRIREWGEEAGRRTAVEIDARSVGHDLARGTSAFRWAVRGRSDPAAAVAADGGAGRRADRFAGGAVDGVAPSGAQVPGGIANLAEAVPEWIVAAVDARRAAGVANGEERPEGAEGGLPRSGPALSGAAVSQAPGTG